MRYHDPYDFPDDSDEEEGVETDEDQYDDQCAVLEIAGSDAGSASSYSDTRSSTLYSATTTSHSESGTAFSHQRVHDWDDDSDDERMSTSSDASLATRIQQDYSRDMATSEVYQLPVDEEERDRLRKQHHMFISIMQAKYPPFMERVLASTIPGEKRVLDLGCGNGEWISDVARDFPFCECVAIDLVPIRDSRGLPPNVKTEVDDVNLGLQHCYGQFDVVHVRLIASGVKDYQLLIEDISRILRPGGVMELCEFDFSIYDQNQHPFSIHLHEPMASPYWARWMAHLRHAVQRRGGDIFAAGYLWQWATNHPAFENIEYRDVWLPTVPGNHSEYPGEFYALLRENVSSFLRAGKPLICGSGLSEEDFEFLRDQTLWELHHSDETQFTRLQCLWASKRMDYVDPPNEA